MIKKFKACIMALLLPAAAALAQQKTITFTKAALRDKIMGGWAGQTIAVTFGGPYEFRYNGTFIQDYQPLTWYDGYLKKTMVDNPGLYDDLYMDLTFVEVFERLGLDAPVDSFANAFAHAGYVLWHANQSARYNILAGIRPPLSGNWVNNPHADDIDYQIEADFAGLMSPAMPNTASAISDKIGHIMNYGDGWYGGVFVGAMYALAFTSRDIERIVEGALQTIPPASDFYRCIADVIRWHRAYPLDWHRTWWELQKAWSSEAGCPDGVFDAFDIDAKINAAYVVLGLLYGNGDFGRTLEIATRAGQDADCNPSTAGGVLGTVLGYKNIPSYWKMGLAEAESIDFKYTSMSLHKVYETGFRQALENIRRHGGRVEGDSVVIVREIPQPVSFEQSFPAMVPLLKQDWPGRDIREKAFAFEGTGFVVLGNATRKKDGMPDPLAGLGVTVDGQQEDTVRLPTSYTIRRNELCWKYGLANGRHTVKLRALGGGEEAGVNTTAYIVYGDRPIKKK